jgi:drug/metabolite transporter (DMT)-like permease
MVPLTSGGPALGFALALGAACCYETGYALQALEARRAPARTALRPALLIHLLRRPLWVSATLLSLAGWPLQVLALQHAPLTLVQPTLALGLLLLLALGVRILGEHVGPREVVGVVAIIGAVGVMAWGAPSAPGHVSAGEGTAVALGLLAAIAVLPFAVSAVARSPVPLLVVGAGAADGLAAFVAKIVAQDASTGRWGAVLAWAALVAAVVLVGLVAESSALQKAAATRVAPAVLSMQIAIPIVLAPLVGGESWGDTPLGGAVLAAALAALVAGVALVGSSRAVAGFRTERLGER